MVVETQSRLINTIFEEVGSNGSRLCLMANDLLSRAVQDDVVIYHRDYRELGQWITQQPKYTIGRYMVDANAISPDFAKHCNQLSEVWVPGQLQLGFRMFSSSLVCFLQLRL